MLRLLRNYRAFIKPSGNSLRHFLSEHYTKMMDYWWSNCYLSAEWWFAQFALQGAAVHVESAGGGGDVVVVLK